MKFKDIAIRFLRMEPKAILGQRSCRGENAQRYRKNLNFIQINPKLRFLALLLFLCLIYGSTRLYFYLTDDFRIANITYSLPYHPEWEISTSDKDQSQLDSILTQQFSYLGKGAQAYAFESEDGKYVLKFFKFKHLKPSWIQLYLPDLPIISEMTEKSRLRKERKLNSAFNGYKLAYDVHKQDSGLIYMQLNPSGKALWITVKDKLGLPRSIDLGQVVFVIQRKGVTFRKVLGDALAQKNYELAKTRIKQIINLYLKEYSKGIYDHDHGVLQNTGFIGEEAFHLDVGKLKWAPEIKQTDIYEKDLLKVVYKIAFWIQNKHPSHQQVLFDFLERLMTEVTGRSFALPKVIPVLKH